MNQAILDDKFFSNHLLYKLLEQATDEEKLQLTRIVMNDRDKAPYSYTQPLHVDKLFDEITCSGGNSFANVYRGQGNSYLDMLDDVAKTILKKKPFIRYKQIEHYDTSECYDDNIQEFALQIYLNKNNIKFSNDIEGFREKTQTKTELRKTPEKYESYLPQAKRTLEAFLNNHARTIEEQIVYKLLDISYSKMSDIEKQQFDQAVQNIALEKGLTNKKLARGVAGLIVLGEMGGFTTYMLMSIFLSKIGLGVFGFGVFTGASTLLGIVLGPVGWAASATWVLWGFTSPNKTKISKIVATIALIRLRLHDEETERRAAKKAQAALAKTGIAKLWAALSNESNSSSPLTSKPDIAKAAPKRSSIMNKSALTFLRPQNPQQAYLDIHRKKRKNRY